VGNPIDELLNITEKEHADMIVMGTKGRTNLRNILIGSVAEKIFRKSPVPVLSYRDEKHIDSKSLIADY
jgi:nucleotide-binding universal stress UspA family protein